MSYKKTIEKLYKILEQELSPDLTYHGIHHTRDVHQVCQFYIKHFDIKKNDGQLLEVAAVGHDIGFTKVYDNHEQASAEITSAIMNDEGFNKKEIRKVEKMILATKIPQNPQTFLSSLLCDADLDYLGRDDFKKIGDTLKQEWENYNVFPNLDQNFDTIQIGFLRGHNYHTEYAQEHRSPVKIAHIDRLEQEEFDRNPKK
jgi:Uncharacterized protein conserved in bacteria